jgi:pSer/pThr/pTyr-binding forkhead associated (FHA) protein
MSVQLVVASGNRSGLAIPIRGERFVIGRADDCHLKPRSELISRYHCEIIVKDGTVVVHDLESKNGVFVNDGRVAGSAELKNGDKLSMGSLEFYVNITFEMKVPKATKVTSVSEAVARTVEMQSVGAKKSAEDTITDWLLEGNNDATETQVIVPDMANLHEQSEDDDNSDNEDENAGPPPMDVAVKPGDHASSRDAATETLRKFFKGGK